MRKLALYAAAWPRIIGNEALARLEALARAGRWEDLALTFFRDTLSVPVEELEELRTTDLWPPLVADGDAAATFTVCRLRDARRAVLG